MVLIIYYSILIKIIGVTFIRLHTKFIIFDSLITVVMGSALQVEDPGFDPRQLHNFFPTKYEYISWLCWYRYVTLQTNLYFAYGSLYFVTTSLF